MFVLAELKDTIRIAPDQFHLKLVEAIRDEINRKLANKVLLNLGLCIALKDIVSLKDSIILPGDGASHTEVLFRYIVFRPTIGSILTGKIRSCSREGVHVTLGFFDDILIPPSALQHPSRFEEAEQAWVWEYPLEDGAKHDLFMDIDAQQASTSAAASAAAAASTQQSEVKTPYRIIAAINESGLGVLSWWDQQTQGGDEGDENEDEDNVEYENDEDGEGAYEE
ncbi:DNA-directed RNA polymerase III subunit RPC8 isoform X3 [Rhagoletis pomonella]|uniref:DNA-directed RNA polymerase III subunit RPC8 isoform X3 n=1 Tax=Rhagoletis pomonella TaxID=28610 RepID=UPI0017844257|nr:DNA-directed RNA polymerase III subunit RPC8 isoform X3 [Rhagoletis pomonella]